MRKPSAAGRSLTRLDQVVAVFLDSGVALSSRLRGRNRNQMPNAISAMKPMGRWQPLDAVAPFDVVSGADELVSVVGLVVVLVGGASFCAGAMGACAWPSVATMRK